MNVSSQEERARDGATVHVAPDGNDRWSGRLARPSPDGRDGPVASLERAQELVRQLRREQPAGPIRVLIAAGTWPRTASLRLSAEDSGAPSCPVVWEGHLSAEVRLVGGKEVGGFRPVRDEDVLRRLDPEARGHVLVADLRGQGISDFGRLRSRGFSRPVVPAHMELFFAGRPMTLARWPNDAFATIAEFAEEQAGGDGHGGQLGRLEAGFHYVGDRPRRWSEPSEAWVHGYWAWDWANTYEQVESIDLDARLIRTRPPHGQYGFRAGQRFFFLNVLEELDSPGEYYVDREGGLLYFWPPGSIEEGRPTVSLLETPFIEMEDVSDVTIRNLTFECARGSSILVRGGRDVRIESCTFRNLGNSGVIVEGGRRHRVTGCEVHDVGEAGIELAGGEPQTLDPAEHLAENNHVYRYARWSRCYRPGIGLRGVGLRAAHNLIYDAPHVGILFGGNDHLIEYNEIHHVTLETGDCGALYAGRSWTARGTTIRHNFIHHTGGCGMGSMGVYLDDQLSGHAIVGNVFWKVTRAAFIGGGRDNRVENNIFVDCEPAVHVDGRGMVGGPVWGEQVATLKAEVRALGAARELYRRRYPELASLDRYLETDELVPPEGNVIARNVCLGGRWMDVLWGAEQEHLQVGENLVEGNPHFLAPEKGDFRLAPDSPAWQIGFDPIPMDRIGLRS